MLATMMSNSLSTRLAIMVAVIAASSATGISEVPAQTTSTVPLPEILIGLPTQVTARAARRYFKPGTRFLRLAILLAERQVTNTLALRRRRARTLAAISLGSLPWPIIT